MSGWKFRELTVLFELCVWQMVAPVTRVLGPNQLVVIDFLWDCRVYLVARRVLPRLLFDTLELRAFWATDDPIEFVREFHDLLEIEEEYWHDEVIQAIL